MEGSVAVSPLESELPWLSSPTEGSSAKGSNWQVLGSLQFILEAPFAIPVAIFRALWPIPPVLKTPASAFPPYQVQVTGSHPAHSSELTVRVNQRSLSQDQFLGLPCLSGPGLTLPEVRASREHRGLWPVGPGTTWTIFFWNEKRTTVF